MSLVLKTPTDPGTAEWLPEGDSTARSQFLLRPSVPPDPDNGVYATFATVYAAAVANQGLKTVFVQGDGVSVPIEAGVYDMANIVLIGLTNPGTATGQQTMTTAAGAAVTTFNNFINGTENIILNHLGTASPLAPFAPAAGSLLLARTGKHATWQSGGGAQPIVQLGGGPGSGLAMAIEDGTLIVDAGTDVFDVAVAGQTLQLRLYDDVAIDADTISSILGSDVELFFVGVGPTEPTFANLAGTLSTFVGAGGLKYIPLQLANWNNVDPGNVATALNRIAAAIGPIL